MYRFCAATAAWSLSPGTLWIWRAGYWAVIRGWSATGQRKGLGVSAGVPVYVVRKDLETGTVVLGPNSALYTRELTADRVNLISVGHLEGPLQVTAKTRYTQQEAEATVEPLPGGRIRVTFQEPQRAVTAGQAVVLYQGEAVLGGGTICS